MTKFSAKERNIFLKQTIALSIPIIIQMLLINGVTFADTLMIGQLGETSIAAVGVASQMFFLVTMFLYGITSAGGIFFSQFWGAKDKHGVQKVLGIIIVFSVIICGIAALLSTLFPHIVMNIFTKDAAVIESGSTYLRIVGFSYILSAISFSYAMGLRSTGDAKTPLMISLISLSIDVIGNYLLIFGIGSFPELGIAGAAISTSVSRIVEVLLYWIITTFRKDCPIKFSFKYSLNFNRAFIKRFFKIALPVVFNDILWSVGMVCYKIAYSKIGTDALAAVQVIESINNLFFVSISGLGSAVAIIVGTKIGENKEEEAHLFTIFSLFFAIILGLLVGILIFIISPIFVQQFNINADVSEMAINSLKVLAILQPLKALTMVEVVGILRGAGDATYSMLLEMGSIWLIGVPVAFISVLIFEMPLPLIYLMVGSEEITKLFIGLKRIKSKKYIHNLVN
ncbi:MAG: MATE family efflux transporter [Sphaerochaetaceae bacterium]|nr:MATE family efflux transporter [Sphaerochaetaceae bacterium]